MKRLFFRLGITLLAFSAGIAAFLIWDGIRLLPGKIQSRLNGAPHTNELSLLLSAETTALRVGQEPTIRIHVTNNSDETVTLVHPGDGSESGWRTPVVQWSILEAGDSAQHPAGPDFKLKVRGCGNVNALESDEVFRLGPGETKELKEWLPPFVKPGSYRVKFLYANRPSMEWKGLALGVHHPGAMWRIRHSTECTLTSNELPFTISE